MAIRLARRLEFNTYSLMESRFMKTRITSVVLAILLASQSTFQVIGQEQQRGDRGRFRGPPRTTEPEKKLESEGEKKEKKEVVAVVGGDIMTVTRETVRGGTILISDGKITAVGQGISIPEGATKIDATGKIITPGFVAIDMAGVGLSAPASGAKYIDSLDPFDRNISLCLSVGITTGCIQIRSDGGSGRQRAEDAAASEEGFPITERFIGLDPDAAEMDFTQEQAERDYGEYVAVCKCCGLPILPTEPITSTPATPITAQKNAVIKMSFGKLDGMLVSESAFMDLTPGSLTGALNQHNWRKQLASARKYLEDLEAHQKAIAAGKKEQAPRKSVSDETLQLVQGNISANNVSDMRDMAALAKELKYKLVIAGGGEAWVIPNELSEANVSVIMTPRNRRSASFGEENTSGTWVETPRVLEQTGVPFSLSTLSSSISLNGLAGRDLTSLPLEAAFAIRGGASERAAMAALTIVPARQMGLENRIGSIEVGKDADLLLFGGDPLDYRSYVETAMVNGRIVYTRTQDRVLPVYDR
jgi:hypothetical protein